jgi:hypothetical protein
MKRSPLFLAALLSLAPLASTAASPETDSVLVAATSSRPIGLRSDAVRQVLSALADYQKAYEAQDLDQLRDVWEMAPAEQTLLEQSWTHCRPTSVTVRPGPVITDGPRAKVMFQQVVDSRCGGSADVRTSDLEAVLHRDAEGRWRIASLGAPPTRRPVSALAGQAAAGDEREVLATLDRYAAALAACDTPQLSTLWISNKSERQALQTACLRDGRPDVALSEPRVSLRTERSLATVDFVQTTAFGAARPDRTELRAVLLKRSGGEWSIWKIKEAD